MGQYQTRTVKSTDEEQGFTDISAEEATGTPSGDPPVFGSPIDSKEMSHLPVLVVFNTSGLA